MDRDSLFNSQNEKFCSLRDKNNALKIMHLILHFLHCGPQISLYSKLLPAETFPFQMWPFEGFEFETPDLIHAYSH